MRDKVAAVRYAQGYLSFAKENIGIKRAFEELSQLSRIIEGSPGLREFFTNPEITLQERTGLINKVFKEDFSQEALNFLDLLIKRGRISQVSDIRHYAKVIYQRERGIEDVDLMLAAEKDKDLKGAIKEKLEKKLHKKIEAKTKTDAALIGGAQVVCGNIIIDGSIKRKLSDLKEKLMSVKVN